MSITNVEITGTVSFDRPFMIELFYGMAYYHSSGKMDSAWFDLHLKSRHDRDGPEGFSATFNLFGLDAEEADWLQKTFASLQKVK